jgi:nitroreductase
MEKVKAPLDRMQVKRILHKAAQEAVRAPSHFAANEWQSLEATDHSGAHLRHSYVAGGLQVLAQHVPDQIHAVPALFQEVANQRDAQRF